MNHYNFLCLCGSHVVFCSFFSFIYRNLWLGERVAYFIGYASAVFVLCSIDFKVDYFFWNFAFEMAYSVPGLIYTCFS